MIKISKGKRAMEGMKEERRIGNNVKNKRGDKRGE